ncbi:hypothetical protein, partial [Endozoicomonas sp. SESOKO3]|uniref:hypothetical protein n=1 Tax=Endozoicomonas sp. SESOKO3 TaxID=2828744 RepID=UPI00214794B7
ALAVTDQSSPAIAMRWWQGEKPTGDRTLLQLENQLRASFGLLPVQATASAPATVQTVTTPGGITTVKTGQQVRIAYKALADPLSGFGGLVGDENTRSLFQRVQYYCNRLIDQLPGAHRSRLGNLRSLLTQVAWNELLSQGQVTSQTRLLADPVDAVVSVLNANELRALAGIDNLAGQLGDVLTHALKDQRGDVFTATDRQRMLTRLSGAVERLTNARAVRNEWTRPGQLPLDEVANGHVPVSTGSRKTLALTSPDRQKITRMGDQHLIAVENQKGALSTLSGDELTGFLALLRQEPPASQHATALQAELQRAPASANPDYYRDAIKRILSPLTTDQTGNLENSLLGLFRKPSLTGAEPLLAEYFFHKRLKAMETADPAGLRNHALRANEWLDLLQQRPPLPPGPGRETLNVIPDNELGRHQASVQTKGGQQVIRLARRDDLAFSEQGPGYSLTHNEGDRKRVFRLQLPDGWPDGLVEIRLFIQMEHYRRMQRRGT